MFFSLSDYFTCVTHACVPVLFASVSTAKVSVLNAGHSVLETEVFVAQEGRPVPETCAFVILTVLQSHVPMIVLRGKEIVARMRK